MPLRGVSGVWFRLAEAQDLLKAKKLVPELSLQIQQFSGLEAAYGAQVGDLRAALAATQAANAKLTLAVAASQHEASQAQEAALQAQRELDRWWRSPWIWAAVGGLAGAGVMLAVLH